MYSPPAPIIKYAKEKGPNPKSSGDPE